MRESPQAAVRFPEFATGGSHRRAVRARPAAETFELTGFASIETRAVEPIDRLAKQGEIDKEVYVLHRLYAEPNAPPVPAALRPHRAVRPCWRMPTSCTFRSAATRSRRSGGERPQEGRYREFTQADIDIVDTETLAAHHDVELPLVTLAALERLHVDLGLPRS